MFQRLLVALLVIYLPICQANEEWSPDFLIVGAQKSGTTVLFKLIRQHPLVIKKGEEIHYFDLKYQKGSEWYKSRYPDRPTPAHKIGDKSPYYLFHPLVPERVYALNPKMKIIMVLRNPVDRAYSQYWHNREMQNETLSFKDAIDQEEVRLAGEKDKILQDPTYNSYEYQHYSYLARGIYVEQIQRWLSFFPREQILIISSKDLRHHQQDVLNQVFTFLELPNFEAITPLEYRRNYPSMSSIMQQKLANYFQPYNQQLEELLGIQFHWE